MPAKPEWRSLGRLWPYLREFPLRVGIALSLLVAAKLAGVSLPLVMKHLVDALDTEGAAVVAIPLLLLLFYGVLRLIVVLFSELRDVIFGRVAERAMRRAALEVFRHLHRLDLGYHLSRQTGGLSRDIERGVSGISFLLRFLTFYARIRNFLELAKNVNSVNHFSHCCSPLRKFRRFASLHSGNLISRIFQHEKREKKCLGFVQRKNHSNGSVSITPGHSRTRPVSPRKTGQIFFFDENFNFLKNSPGL